jgi:hypothetical protein
VVLYENGQSRRGLAISGTEKVSNLFFNSKINWAWWLMDEPQLLRRKRSGE